MMNFSGKSVLITGGTGSFGSAMARRLLKLGVSRIIIFSRDEKKQEDMRSHLNSNSLEFVIGDVRNYGSIVDAMCEVDYVFHAAALKQVPSCEFYPMEAIRTNVLGTENVLKAAVNSRVKKVVCLSTDKAVHPVNAMGITKALMEKVMASTARRLRSGSTVVCATRYGNVVGSRGSVIPVFQKCIENGMPLLLTDPQMTRFIMTLDEAIDLVLYAFKNAKNGDIFVKKANSATVSTIKDAVIEYTGAFGHPVRVIGTRHGEKKHETLLSREELIIAEEQSDYFCVPCDPRGLNYAQYFTEGEVAIDQSNDYSSNIVNQLTKDQLVKLIATL